MMQDTLEDSLRMAELLMGQAASCLEDQTYAPRRGTAPSMARRFGEQARVRQLIAQGHLREARLSVQDEIEGQDTQDLLISELIGQSEGNNENEAKLRAVWQNLDMAIDDLGSFSYASWTEDSRALEVCQSVRKSLQEILGGLADVYLIGRE